jgi:hypothetical protein
MVYVSPEGRDWSSVVNFDVVGKTYVAFAVAWTGILFTGIGWLMLNRNLYFLKMRNIFLAIVSTSFLHLYLVKILLAYTTNGHFSCGAEFWIMSIYLPFGIALFQANMVQLQSVSNQQKKFLQGQGFLAREAVPLQLPQHGLRRLWKGWREMTAARRAEILIGVGMVAQVFFLHSLPLKPFGLGGCRIRSMSAVSNASLVDGDFGHLSRGSKVS